MKRFVLSVATLAVFVAPGALASARSAAPLDARHSPYLVGNASPAFAAGRPGRIALLRLTHRVAVFRNNTRSAVENVHITFAVVGRNGKRLAILPARQTAHPYHIAPGEIGLIGGNDARCGIPTGKRYEACGLHWPTGSRVVIYKASYTKATGDSGHDLFLTISSDQDGQVTGTAEAPQWIDSSWHASDWRLWVYCFSADGVPAFETQVGLMSEQTFEPGQTVSFRFHHNTAACPIYLMSYVGLGPGAI